MEFHRRGVCCVIDADDPALFGTTISDEYAKVAAMMGEGALPHFVRNAIDASFAADSVKAGLHERLNEFCAETIEGRRNARNDHAGTRISTSPLEEYLEGIYRLEREGSGVTHVGLGAGTGRRTCVGLRNAEEACGRRATSSIGRAAKCKLTPAGLEVGVPRHATPSASGALLTDVLGMPWDEVHDEACVLEHAISERVEERLVAVLGRSQRPVPHGHPIPPVDLSEPVRPACRSRNSPGAARPRHRRHEEVPEMLRYLVEVGMRPGAAVRCVEKAPLGGPVTVDNARGRHAISLELARMVTVGPSRARILQPALTVDATRCCVAVNVVWSFYGNFRGGDTASAKRSSPTARCYGPLVEPANGGASSPPRSCTAGCCTSPLNMFALYQVGTFVEMLVRRAGACSRSTTSR